MKAALLLKAVESVTGKWERQRKAEEKGRRSQATRERAFCRSIRSTIKEVAWEVMEEAYHKARGPYSVANARQIMYAARPEILARTGETELDDQYFTQTLLPDYIEENGCQHWKVAYDARGNFYEPHTGCKVPLGTVEVRDYLRGFDDKLGSDGVAVEDCRRFPTCGPANRYGAVLFVEKEGFRPLLTEARFAERYDIAIMSTKGLSVTAARELVDITCGELGLPLLIMHDFDKSGFSIAGTLQRDTRRYAFAHDCNVIDLGLRLTDVLEYGLQSEPVNYGCAISKLRANLQKNGATPEELDFLCPLQGRPQRVELNAFTSDRLVEWLEAKLAVHGIRKVIPDETVLETAYRRALRLSVIKQQLAPVERMAAQLVADVETPSNLAERLTDALRNDPSMPWDQVLGDLAAKDAVQFADDSAC